MSKITPEAAARCVPHTLAEQLAHAQARIAVLERTASLAQLERLRAERRLRAAEQGVPERYARHAPDWGDIDFGLDADRGGQ